MLLGVLKRVVSRLVVGQALPDLHLGFVSFRYCKKYQTLKTSRRWISAQLPASITSRAEEGTPKQEKSTHSLD